MTLEKCLQYAAGLAYRAHKPDLHAATDHFTSLIEQANFQLPTNAHDYVEYWGPRLNDSGEIESHASLSGRHRVLTDADARIIYCEARNWWLAGMSAPYSSIGQLKESSKAVRDVIMRTHASDMTVMRALHQIDPNFSYRKTRSKPFLDEQHRDMRIHMSEELMKTFEADKPFTLYVDEKVMCLNNDKCMGWFSTDAEDYAYALPPVKSGNKVVKIKYVIAVNYLLGPVWMSFYTGSYGMPFDRPGCNYFVSLASKQTRVLQSINMFQCSTQTSSPSLFAAGSVTRVHC